MGDWIEAWVGWLGKNAFRKTMRETSSVDTTSPAFPHSQRTRGRRALLARSFLGIKDQKESCYVTTIFGLNFEDGLVVSLHPFPCSKRSHTTPLTHPQGQSPPRGRSRRL